MPWLKEQQRLYLVAVREERREPTGIVSAMSRKLGCMIILDIVIHITDKSMNDATAMLTFIFSFALVVGLVLAIWFNMKSGQKWIDNL